MKMKETQGDLEKELGKTSTKINRELNDLLLDWVPLYGVLNIERSLRKAPPSACRADLMPNTMYGVTWFLYQQASYVVPALYLVEKIL